MLIELEGVEPVREYHESRVHLWMRTLCEIVGHTVKRYDGRSIMWTECDHCSKHLSGPEPDFGDYIGAIYSRAFMREMVERETPFLAALRAS